MAKQHRENLMALHDNFAIQTNDASMMAKLHRQNGLELVDKATTDGNEPARLSADTAVEHANSALVTFHEALGRLPDLAAAFEAKRSGDIILLESGSALNAARRKLGPAL
jgi:DNA-binding Lrp family transcriptional regulator